MAAYSNATVIALTAAIAQFTSARMLGPSAVPWSASLRSFIRKNGASINLPANGHGITAADLRTELQRAGASSLGLKNDLLNRLTRLDSEDTSALADDWIAYVPSLVDDADLDRNDLKLSEMGWAACQTYINTAFPGFTNALPDEATDDHVHGALMLRLLRQAVVITSANAAPAAAPEAAVPNADHAVPPVGAGVPAANAVDPAPAAQPGAQLNVNGRRPRPEGESDEQVISGREMRVLAYLQDHPEEASHLIDEDPGALSTNAKVFLWSTVDSPDEFSVPAFVSAALRKFRPRPTASAGMPSGEQIGELVKDVVGTAVEAERAKIQKQFETMHSDHQDTSNSVNALSANSHSSRLYKEQLNLTDQLKVVDKIVAETQAASPDGEISAALQEHWDSLKNRKRTLAIIAAKESEGSMNVYEYMEDSKYYHPENLKEYREARAQMEKDQKSKFKMTHLYGGGASGYSGGASGFSGGGGAPFGRGRGAYQQPHYQQRPQFQQPPAQYQQQFQQQSYQQQSYQPPPQGGPPQQQSRLGNGGMGRGAPQPAWLTQGAGGGGAAGAGPQFIDTKFGLRLSKQIDPTRPVFFPGEQNLAAPPKSVAFGGTFVPRGPCSYCGEQDAHEAWECPTLRAWHQQGKIDNSGTPVHGRF